MAASAVGLNYLISFPKKVQVVFGQDTKVEAQFDSEYGYVPICYIKLKKEQEITEAEMKKWCKKYLRLVEIPRKFIIKDDLEYFKK